MQNTSRFIKQYASAYIAENLILTLIITLPLFMMLFVISLRYNVVTHDLLISLFPLLCGIIYIGFIYARTFRFKNLIHVQEKLLNVSFTDDALKPLYPKTLFYCSESWFMKAGCWAFHRDYLTKITVRVRNENSPARHYVVEFYTTHGKRYIEGNMQVGDIKKLQEWHNK